MTGPSWKSGESLKGRSRACRGADSARGGEISAVSGKCWLSNAALPKYCRGSQFGKATLAALEEGSDQSILDFDCERLRYASAFAVCLVVDPTLTTYSAEIFDHRFRRLHKLPLTALPSRVRVSPDGCLAAITVFVTGHRYAQAGFSTRTTIVEMGPERQIAELEQFSVTRNGTPFKEQDFNFWGVIRHFFATH